ncbi:hypothetical protein F4553_005269 [Allocatelliglobosispora scoriae]|uniref:Uncharacterized protein n=1 Tax=Allocatelliglobosispora scoriae TaxID=643052 RepID=A0A841BYU6_9ACTN|nr:hypothetical protein [Allocatelliglobosispora scoriae]MBB5871890.1 hypothetical protein [Allocatelliglobosispora scoriae]
MKVAAGFDDVPTLSQAVLLVVVVAAVFGLGIQAFGQSASKKTLLHRVTL